MYSSTVVISVVVNEEPSQFGSSDTANKWLNTGQPVHIWNPKAVFTTLAADITGYWPSGNPKFDKKVKVDLPPEIGLIHELGHAKQWIEDETQFTRFIGGVRTEGTKTTEQLEAANLKIHENPVCKEMGLKQRIKYNDFDIAKT